MRRSQRIAARAHSTPIPVLPSRAHRVRRYASVGTQLQPETSTFHIPQLGHEVTNVTSCVTTSTSSPVAPLVLIDHIHNQHSSSTSMRRRRPPRSTLSASVSASNTNHAQYYIARSILSSMRKNGKNYYLVEWVDYPQDQATWEPIENVRDTIAYQQYVFGHTTQTQTQTQHNSNTGINDNTSTPTPQVEESDDTNNTITVALSVQDDSISNTIIDQYTVHNNDVVDVDAYTVSDNAPSTPPHTSDTVDFSTLSAPMPASSTPMYLCPNDLCGAYISSNSLVNHINTSHLGSLLTTAAATKLGVRTCPHCSKHFRQLHKHQCPVRHLTPSKHAQHVSHIQTIPVTSMSDALAIHLPHSSTTNTTVNSALINISSHDTDLEHAIQLSLMDQNHTSEQQQQLAVLACADGVSRHIINIAADGDCMYRALCVAWDIPQSQHYQLREHVAEYLQQLPISELKDICIQYDNISQALFSATSYRVGHGSLHTNTQTQHQVETLPMHEWSDTTWTNIRDMYIHHVTLKKGRYGGLLDIQALCNSYCRNVNVYLASDISRGVLSPITLQPPLDTVDDSNTADNIGLLHVNTTDYTKEGNHFDIICTDAVHELIRARTQPQRQQPLPPPLTVVSSVPLLSTERVDASTNTDTSVHSSNNTGSRDDIPVLLPLSLPPCYRNMPSMWRVIPATSKHSWVGLCSIYLQRAWRAHKQNDIDARDRALIAFLLLPRQALQRDAGQRSAKYKLKRKLQRHITHTRETATSITLNVSSDNNDTVTHTPTHEANQLARNVKRAAELVRAGHISRAAAAITQTAPVTLTPSVIEQLKQLHPPAGSPVSLCPDNAPVLYISGKDLNQHFRAFNDNGAAPGPSGWTGDLIQPLLSNNRCLDPIAMLLMLIINGEAKGQLQHMLQAMRGVPLAKPQSTKVRPIDMGEVWVKVAGRIAMKQVDTARVFPIIQYGTAVKGGCEKAIHIVQTLLEKHTHDNPINASTATVAISTDIANAFNTCSRAHIFSTMCDTPATYPLLRMFHWSHSSSSNVLVYNNDTSIIAAVIPSAAGTKQGDPLASFGYNLSMQPTYSAVQTHVPQVTLVAIHDDLTIVGPLEYAMKAFDYFNELLLQRGDLKLQPTKCRVLSPSSITSTHTAVQKECESRSLTFIAGCMSLLGGYIGTDDVIARAIVKDTVASVYPLLDALTHANMPSAFAMLILKHCITSKVSYLTRVTRPEVARAALLELDERILKMLTTKLEIPSTDQLTASTVTLIRLPTHLGGIGIPSAADSSAAAFLASLCLSLPLVRLIPDAPYTASIALAHATVLTPGTGVVVSDRVPSTVTAMLLTYSKPTPLVEGLQRHIQQLSYKHTQRGLLASFTTNAQRAALLSASAPRAGMPLTSIPNADHPSPVLPSNLFNQYIRMRLQLPPRDTPLSMCNILQCNTPLSTDIERTHHHQVCKHIRNREATLRHNKVLNAVLRIARDAGFAASHEEPIRDEQGHKLRPDAIITPSTSNHSTMYIDVSITHPAAQSYNTQAASITNPLVTAKARERMKHSKYDRVATQDNARFFPLVLESYGAFGREFDSFLSLLGSAAADFHGLCEREMKRWMMCAYHDIVVALHAGNALMALRTFKATSFVEGS